MISTITETISQLHQALRDYIEATYHISHPTLVELRRTLLDRPTVVSQRPYIESTPRYVTGDPYGSMSFLDAQVRALFQQLSSGTKPILFDPPYLHQEEALRAVVADDMSAVVMTGTGSGKTESFLLPILAKLSVEAYQLPEQFRALSGIRALILYPMNALVNDQLGRLRLLFGAPRVRQQFIDWAGRPVHFARYTSRTLYPGVRQVEKDQRRLKPIGEYYVDNLRKAKLPPSDEQRRAAKLVGELQKRGKWPAKEDLIRWYGEPQSRWVDPATGRYKRCVTLPGDSELLTRHEVHELPADILVTNYSMLEYMLMRPLERPVFDATREWLAHDPHNKLILVIDEAHLYRGAAGSEVALLIRRLRQRLEVSPDRIQVVCTSASFRDKESAASFAAQLSGKQKTDFRVITGDKKYRSPEDVGTQDDASALAMVDLPGLYAAGNGPGRLQVVAPFLGYRGTPASSELSSSLYEALKDFGPLNRLVNATMDKALPVDELNRKLFPDCDAALASRAVTVLLSLASIARKDMREASLLPCRIHSFHRGLPGLWACMDPQCAALQPEDRGGPTGMLYGQPRETCECGARVLEM
jgi:ATP-dependent helicase YprA (DUF1998 family)